MGFTPSKYQQAVFDWIENRRGKNLVVEAVAGSGKTTTGVQALNRIPITDDVVFLAFNKHIATELQARVPKNTKVSTYHALGFSSVRSAFGSKVKVDGDKLEMFLKRDDSMRYSKSLWPICKRLVSLCKANLLEASTENLQELAAYHNIELNGDSDKVFATVKKLLAQSVEVTDIIDFDDMCYMPVQLQLPAIKHDFLFVDELQDTNRVQIELALMSVKDTGRIVGFGDEKQCVIDGTRILVDNSSGVTYNSSKKNTGLRGDTMLVQDIAIGDFVVSAIGNGKVKKQKVMNKYKHYQENLPVTTVVTESGKSLTTTMEHVYFSDFLNQESGNLYFTYLMQKDDNFRIGMASPYRERSGVPIPGFKGRSSQERADAIWVLEVSPTMNEARFWEEWYSVVYGIPKWLFRADGRGYRIAYDDKMIDRMFSSIPTSKNASNLLFEKGYDDERPHHAPKCRLGNRRNFSIVLCGETRSDNCTMHRYTISGSSESDKQKLESAGIKTKPAKKGKGWRVESACKDLGSIYALYDKVKSTLNDVHLIEKAHLTNGSSLSFMPAAQVLPGMYVFVLDGESIVRERVVSNTPSKYTGYVYDLDIENSHNYVAEGIVTHNSIYGFRGADVDAIPNLINRLDANTLPLSISYRNPKKVVALVNQKFPEIRFECSEWAKDGIIETKSYETATGMFQPDDMILCRTNAPLVQPAFDLIRKGVKAIIKGKDIGNGLQSIIKRMHSDGSVFNLIDKLQEYRNLEAERLARSEKWMQLASLHDKLDTIIAVSDGCTTTYDVIAKLNMIFSDDNAGVVFSSVHKAKGLEAERVFILKPELMPHPMAKQDWAKQTERNIEYVAITRTLNELYFVQG